MWDVATKELKKTFTVKQWGRINAVFFSADGRILMSGNPDGTVRLWHTATGQIKMKLTGHTHRVTGAMFSPDGKTIVSVSLDSTVRLWSADTGRLIKTFKGHARWINDVTFSPDGKTIASGGVDGTVLLWQLPPPTNAEALVRIAPSQTYSPAVGQQITLTLDITDGVSVAGFRATVVYDATALRYIKSNMGDYLPDGSTAASPVVETNSVRVSAKSNTGSSDGDGTLATLIFEVIAVKASSLRLSNVSLSNSNGFLFSPRVKGGQVGR